MWILIFTMLVWSTPEQPTSFTAEFATQAKCESAGNQLEQSYTKTFKYKFGRGMKPSIDWHCFEK